MNKIAMLSTWMDGMRDTPHDCIYHYGENCLQHSVQAMILCKEAKLDPLLGLLHDIGKIATVMTRIDGQKRERISFFHHEEIGARWLDHDVIKKALGIDNQFIEDVRWHLKPYLENAPKAAKNQRTWVRDRFNEIDRKSGAEPTTERELLEDMMTWPNEMIINWCYKNRWPFMRQENVLYWDAYIIDGEEVLNNRKRKETA